MFNVFQNYILKLAYYNFEQLGQIFLCLVTIVYQIDKSAGHDADKDENQIQIEVDAEHG